MASRILPQARSCRIPSGPTGEAAAAEPTASLGFANQALVLREVRTLAAQGYGIVLSTHDPDHAFACAITVALLHHGHLTAQGPPAEVLTAARLQSVYGVRVFVEHLASGHTVCAPDLGAT